jgi:hypothetical protein
MLSFLVCGSISTTSGRYATNDAGPYPTNYEDLIKSYLRENLKDPYSVRDLSISPPVRVAVWTGVVRDGNVEGWRSCVSYNAKNGFGGYVGQQYKSYYLKDGTFMFEYGSVPMVHQGC